MFPAGLAGRRLCRGIWGRRALRVTNMRDEKPFIEREDPKGGAPPPEVEEEVRSAVEEYLEALESGDEPDRDAVLAAHPLIASILRERLEAVERLHEVARGTGPSGGAVTGAFQLRCPHCAQAIASVEPCGGLVTCEGCGSSFRIEADGPEGGTEGEFPESVGKFHAQAKVAGGGVSGWADAIAHGIARALVAADETTHKPLRQHGLLTRDSREKERKKYGLKRARKAPQYTKR